MIRATSRSVHVQIPYERIDLTPRLPSASGASGVAFQAALDAHGSGSYYLGKGTYDFDDVQVTLPASFDIELHPEAVILDGRIIHTTTDGAEVPLTGAIDAGSLTIPVDNNVLGAVAGEDLFVMGCIDLLSSDAGASRLGCRQTGEANPMFAGERVRVYETTPTEVTIGGLNQGGTVFPYTITPGASSGARTVSTVRKCTAGLMRWVGGKMQRGSTALSSSPIVFRLTGGAGHVIDTQIQFDQDQTAGVGIYAQRVFGGDFKVDVRRKLHISGSGASSHNAVLLVSCQNTFVSGRVDGGFQALDITHALDGTGVASVMCGARDWKVYSAYEAATDHMGNLGSSFSGVRSLDCRRGIRLRSPKALVQDYQGISRYQSGIGIYVCNGWVDGCHIDGAMIDGHLNGLQIDRGNADDSAESPAAPPRITGRGIRIANAVSGVVMNSLDATLSTDQKRAVGCTDLEVFIADCNRPIQIDEYWNGAKLFGSISGAPDPAYEAILLAGNASNVTLGPFTLHDLGDTAVALRGPGAGSALLTDATTWPEGDEAANLRILDLSVTGEPPLALVEDLTITSTTPLGFGREFGRRQMRGSTAVVDDAGVELNTVTPRGMAAGAQWDAFAALLPYVSDIAGLKDAFGVVINDVGFTPDKIPDALYFARFDFEESAQITTAGASITSFADPISAGAWAQATGAAQPQLDATGFNGRQCGTFDGGDSLRNTDAVATLGWPTGGTFEVWALVQYTGLLGAALDNAVIFQYPTDTTNTSFSLSVINSLGTTRRYRVRVGTGASSVAINDTTVDLMDGEPHIARFVSTGTTIRLDVDGIVGTPVACVAALSGGPVHTIGGDSAGTSANLLVGDINFLGLYPALPDGLANALYNALDIRRTP